MEADTMGRFVSLFIAFFFIVGLFQAVSASSVERSVYFDSVNNEYNVKLKVDASGGGTYYAIEEIVPEEWQVNGVTDNVVISISNGMKHIRWMYYSKTESPSGDWLELDYSVAPSALGSVSVFPGGDLITGNYMFEGDSQEQPVLKSNLILTQDIDTNTDGAIDIFDLVTIGSSFGTNEQDADINNDGIVNIFDMVIIGLNFGKNY